MTEVRVTDSGNPPQAVKQTIVIDVIANPRAWQNVAEPFDSNGDNIVAPLDVLGIINQINNPTVLDPDRRLRNDRPASSLLPYYDTNGDGFCTPVGGEVLDKLPQCIQMGDSLGLVRAK